MSEDHLGIVGTTTPAAAVRVTRPGWRDPRLWLGVLLVAGSVLLGARVMASADESVAVWVVRAPHGQGAPLAPDDVTAARIRFVDAATERRYYLADRPLPDGLVLTRAVGAGELLARDAVGPARDSDRLRVPLEVDPNRVPPGVGPGSVVDVWLSDAAAGGAGGAGSGRTGAGAPALAGVTVVAAPAPEESFAVTGARLVVVAVEEERAAAFERVLGGLQDPVIRVLQRS